MSTNKYINVADSWTLQHRALITFQYSSNQRFWLVAQMMRFYVILNPLNYEYAVKKYSLVVFE